MAIRALILLFALLPLWQANAQGSSDIARQLDRLNVLGSVLYIAAHPDDENTQLLAWLTQEKHFRTGYLSLTRGDGGQNLIGTEQGESLGIIRTNELLAARSIDGAEQFFTRAVDFGFSKTAKETLSLWHREKILADIVWVIRQFQPDIIITRFPGDERAGHGHHQASSILAQEAFYAAADPQRFPEQLTQVNTWQAKRILWNTWLRFLASGDTTHADQLKINIGGINTYSGKHYGEISAKSRDSHKSQGFGSAAKRGTQIEHFAHLAGAPAKQDLFEGIDTTWNRIAGSHKVAQHIKKLQQQFNPQQPSALVAPLINLLGQLQKLPASPWVNDKKNALEQLLITSAGVWLESQATQPSHASNAPLDIRIQALVESEIAVRVTPVQQGKAAQTYTLQQGVILTIPHTIAAPAINQPYWLQQQSDGYTWQVNNQPDIGKAYISSPNSEFVLAIAGHELAISQPVIYKNVDPIRGEVYQAVQIAPAVTANLRKSLLLFSEKNTQQLLQVQLHAHAANSKGKLHVRLPDGWRASPTSYSFHLLQAGEQQQFSFAIQAPANNQPYSGELYIELENHTPIAQQTAFKARQEVRIAYDHIPVSHWYPESRAHLEKLHIKTAPGRIGYFTGSGDAIADVLRQLGYEVELLNSSALLAASNTKALLAQYDTIITGIRALNTDKNLHRLLPALHQFVHEGGVLFMQYNTLTDLPTVDIGPYPFSLGRNRVSDETAAVHLLQPQHPLLNYPNTITAQDFSGWVQERGLYFVSDSHVNYEKILAFQDEGEPLLDGGLISARYGKGRFVYSSLSFFRQLPEGVPGAIRLFANLIAPPAVPSH